MTAKTIFDMMVDGSIDMDDALKMYPEVVDVLKELMTS